MPPMKETAMAMEGAAAAAPAEVVHPDHLRMETDASPFIR